MQLNFNREDYVMRKLLLTSSALVAAASISSYAVADVSVTGGFEWKYTQQAADQTSKDGDSFHTDNEIVIKFSNKTEERRNQRKYKSRKERKRIRNNSIFFSK